MEVFDHPDFSPPNFKVLATAVGDIAEASLSTLRTVKKFLEDILPDNPDMQSLRDLLLLVSDAINRINDDVVAISRLTETS
jgi:hypothetical protein